MTQLEAIFKNCIDVPGTYYLEVIEKLYKRNELAAGSFVALGQKIDLSRLRLPTCFLAGTVDDIVAPEKLLAAVQLVGTRPEDIWREIAPQSSRPVHGRRTLEQCWPKIVRWMKEPLGLTPTSR